ncbi:PH domain-containing protein [Actinoalloteichus hymeniacidonis]|uniref:Membrane protein n=1 Tax=Actinoalloteichus hymeniacidonis TaxID=340345 RepID=A0AAC9HUI0_9PSEU|nr:PH domain-containing protein [Actinoalloteichus hymeniacidonis]AOS65574.1 putative membrane protein [Actinoalloteichus hymeniacidonis]MBB5906336.1 putative membrane protein [Actinoalloteichus hymeniacidonis]
MTEQPATTNPTGPADPHPATDATTEEFADWRRLHPLTPAVAGTYLLGLAVLTAAILIYRSVPGWIIWLSVLPLPILVTLYEWLRLRTTRFRVAGGRFELHTGVLFRSRRSVALDRIRNVDATAEPVGRMYGLTGLRIGTGENASDSEALALSPLGRAEAERLRASLLPRRAEATDSPEIASWTPSWIRFAPFSFTTPLLGLAAFGAVYEGLDILGVDMDRQVIPDLVGRLADFPLPLVIGALLLALLVIGTLGSVLVYAETWWRHRLTEDSEALHVRRGLLTTRNITLERKRVLGVEVREPLSLRWAKGASVEAVATGLGSPEDEQNSARGTLLPPTGNGLAWPVAARVLRRSAFPIDAAELSPHPRIARRRRLGWAVGWVAAPTALLVGLGLLLTDVLIHIGWLFAVVALPIAVLLALDAYRNLGHGLDPEFLVSRKGSASRHTTVLRRTDIIGWTIRRSPFQRRHGLITLSATIAGGTGAYRIPDADQDEGVELADHALPDLVAPFLVDTKRD